MDLYNAEISRPGTSTVSCGDVSCDCEILDTLPVIITIKRLHVIKIDKI